MFGLNFIAFDDDMDFHVQIVCNFYYDIFSTVTFYLSVYLLKCSLNEFLLLFVFNLYAYLCKWHNFLDVFFLLRGEKGKVNSQGNFECGFWLGYLKFLTIKIEWHFSLDSSSPRSNLKFSDLENFEEKNEILAFSALSFSIVWRRKA